MPPNEAARVAAVGSLVGLPLEMAAAFNGRSAAFRPMPKPEPGDWLWTRAGNGQTFNRWNTSGANIPARAASRAKPTSTPGDFAVPDAKGRSVIYLLPLGDFDERGADTGLAPSFDDLARCCAAFHHGLRVEVLPPIASSSREFRELTSQPLEGEDDRALRRRVER